MTSEQLQYLFSIYSMDDLTIIIIDNQKRIYVDDLNREELEWDHTNNLLSIVENDSLRVGNPRVKTIYPFDRIEGLIFLEN